MSSEYGEGDQDRDERSHGSDDGAAAGVHLFVFGVVGRRGKAVYGDEGPEEWDPPKEDKPHA